MWTILIKAFVCFDCGSTPWTGCKATTGETQKNRHGVWHYCTIFLKQHRQRLYKGIRKTSAQGSEDSEIQHQGQ